jgi:hypothetical protein
MANPEVQLVMKVVSPDKGKFIEKRRVDALEEVLFLKENTVHSGKVQISDYWTYVTDER